MATSALLLLMAGAAAPASPPSPATPPEFAVGADPYPATEQPQVEVSSTSETACDPGMTFYCLRSRTNGNIPQLPVITRIGIVADEAGQITQCLRFADEQSSALGESACWLARKSNAHARAFSPYRYNALLNTLDGPPVPYNVLLNWAAPEGIASFAGAQPVQPPRLIVNGYSAQDGPCPMVVCTQDYPSSALRAEHEGQVYYFARVNAQGRAISCWPFIITPDAALNQRSCSIIVHRARFEPATDAQGQPVEAVATGIISWQIPL